MFYKNYFFFNFSHSSTNTYMQKLPKILPHIDIITETSKKTELYSLKLTCLIFGTVTRSPFPVDIVKISAPVYFICMFSPQMYMNVVLHLIMHGCVSPQQQKEIYKGKFELEVPIFVYFKYTDCDQYSNEIQNGNIPNNKKVLETQHIKIYHIFGIQKHSWQLIVCHFLLLYFYP